MAISVTSVFRTNFIITNLNTKRNRPLVENRSFHLMSSACTEVAFWKDKLEILFGEGHQWLLIPCDTIIATTNEVTWKNWLEGWQDGSVVKALAVQAWGLEFRSLEWHEWWMGWNSWPVIPGLEDSEVVTRASWIERLGSSVSSAFDFEETPQRTGWEEERMLSDINLRSLHAYRHMCASANSKHAYIQHTYTHACTHIYIHIYVYTHAHTHARTHTQCTHIHIHIHMHACTHTYTYTYIHKHTYITIYMHKHTHSYARIHKCAYTHTYTHAHTCTHMHGHTHTHSCVHTHDKWAS